MRRAYALNEESPTTNRHRSCDPFVLVICGDDEQATRVIKRNLDPAWNQELAFQGTLASFVERGLELRVYSHSADEQHLLGQVRVALSWLHARRKFRDYAEPLDTHGTLHFEIEWHPRRERSRDVREETQRDVAAITEDMQAAAEGLRLPASIFAAGFTRAVKSHFSEWAEERVARGMQRVYRRAVEYLHNKSEVPPFVAATVTTMWERVWGEVQEPVSEYLKEEFGKAIGIMRHEPPPEEGAGGEFVTDTDDTDDVASAASAAAGTGWCERCRAAPGYAIHRLRLHWLYTMYPYDKSSWKTMRSPWWWLQASLSMFPYWGVAPIFWVTTFAFIDRDDEYQLCQFIVQFKGLIAFTTGAIGIITGALRVAFASDALIECVATNAGGGIEGCPLPLGWPGGWSTFKWELAWWCIEVLTVQLAFVLLPFSSDRAVALQRIVRGTFVSTSAVPPAVHGARLEGGCRRRASAVDTRRAAVAEYAPSSASSPARHASTTTHSPPVRPPSPLHAIHPDDADSSPPANSPALADPDDVLDDTDPHGATPTRLWERWESDLAEHQRCIAIQATPPRERRASLRKSVAFARQQRIAADGSHRRSADGTPAGILRTSSSHRSQSTSVHNHSSGALVHDAHGTNGESSREGSLGTRSRGTTLAEEGSRRITFASEGQVYRHGAPMLAPIPTPPDLSAVRGGRYGGGDGSGGHGGGGGGGMTDMAGCRFSTAEAAVAAHAHSQQAAEKRAGPEAPLEWALAAADKAERHQRRSAKTMAHASARRHRRERDDHPLDWFCEQLCQRVWCCRRPRQNKRRGGLLRRWLAYELLISAVCASVAAFEVWRLVSRVAPPAQPPPLLADANTTAIAVADAITNGTMHLLLHDAAAHALNSTSYRLSAAYAHWSILEDYQLRATLYWCRVLYGLLSLPFALFTVPLLFEALTHSRATGYKPNGECVRQLTARERQAKIKRTERHRARASVRRLSERYGNDDDAYSDGLGSPYSDDARSWCMTAPEHQMSFMSSTSSFARSNTPSPAPSCDGPRAMV